MYRASADADYPRSGYIRDGVLRRAIRVLGNLLATHAPEPRDQQISRKFLQHVAA